MKRISFDCGDKIFIKSKKGFQKGIICNSINTINENQRVRVVMETGEVSEKAIKDIIRR
jgi:hypothetical protein